uniref:Synaptonemal complex protein 1 n=1 Tax=Takifugu rubripes TaxID=31033 RepID=A0A674NQ34_TAKRU
MEKERGFNFQLLIPSKVNNCQAVRPQENLENCICSQICRFMSFLLWIFTQRKYNSVQLFSKLFDEVEKIRCWKVQTNSDNVEKERRLHQNGRTIESLQRTIQELQFCNESLSMKMQEHLDDIENLRNKNNVTKNLCNTLNDTFQRTAEKIQLFESEREETHHLFVENIENIQKMIAEFEILRFQAEADQQEMQKVKEKMLQFEDLQEKYHYEYNVKEEEVAVLQTKLKDKENELQNILLEFSESQKCCRQLQETTNEQHELLKKSQAEQDSLLQELHNAKQCCEETQNKLLKKQIAKEITKSSQLETVILFLTGTCYQFVSFVQISVQQEEHKQLQKPHEEETQRLLNDLESESALASELTDEVGKDKLTAVDAIKNKEETELKCQQKIADMVALMEKHKGHYEQIVGEKDAELVMRKKKETEALAHYKSLELELMSVKTDISQLKLELKTEQNVLEELSAMKKGMSSMKTSLPSDVVNKEVQYYLHCVFIVRNKLLRMISCNSLKLPNVI